MQIPFIFFIILILCCSCKRAATVSQEEEVVSDTTAVETINGECYLVVTGKDSVLLRIDIENTSVTGDLLYRFTEKDKSGGSVFGNFRGDTLVADYKFTSEGMESEREVAFLRQGDTFIEGYGDAVESNGRMVFKRIDSLKFEGKPMLKIDCQQLAWYFRK